MELGELIKQLGIDTCYKFDPRMIVPEERIRAFCRENKCDSYGKNYMCPPYIGTIEEIKVKLKKYHNGILLRYTKYIDVKGDREGVIRTQKDFHAKILRIEAVLKGKGVTRIWGLIGGNCRLCEICQARSGEPCIYPDQARTSPEAIGIDVLGLLNKFGLDSKFHTDKITWTGGILAQGTETEWISN